MQPKFIARHRRFLRRIDVLDRPWLVFGSAPDPSLPPDVDSRFARIDVNNSGRTAAALGLGRAEMTLRAERKPWEEHPNLDTRGLLCIETESKLFPCLRLRRRLRRKPRAHIGRLMTITREERDAVVAEVSGADPRLIGELGKVTNGIAAACYGLLMGAPTVVLAGVSLSKAGHSYHEHGSRRLQVEEDTVVLGSLRDHPRLATTEPELAEATGIRLWEASPARFRRPANDEGLSVRTGLQELLAGVPALSLHDA